MRTSMTRVNTVAKFNDIIRYAHFFPTIPEMKSIFHVWNKDHGIILATYSTKSSTLQQLNQMRHNIAILFDK